LGLLTPSTQSSLRSLNDFKSLSHFLPLPSQTFTQNPEQNRKKSDFDQKKEKKTDWRKNYVLSITSKLLYGVTHSILNPKSEKKIRHLFFSESSHNSSNNFCWCNNERIKYKMLSGNSNFKLRSDVWHFVSKSTE